MSEKKTDRPVHVLVEAVADSPSFRLSWPMFDAISRVTGCEVEYGLIDENVNYEMLKRTDILVVIRGFSWAEERCVKLAESLGCCVVLLIDDHLLEWDDHSVLMLPVVMAAKHGLKYIAKNASVVLSSNSHLANIYASLGKGRTAYSDTVVRDDEIMARDDTPNDDCVRIVYPAFGDHKDLFDAFILPILPILSERFGERISLTVVGPKVDFESVDLGFETKYVPFMPLEEYERFMREERFDIGLSPMHANAFTECKYYNKYLDFATKGIVGVYSNAKPYTLVIESGKNGLLVDDSQDAWLEALTRLIDDAGFRRACLNRSQDDLRKNFNEEAIVPRVVEAIPEFWNYHVRDHRQSGWRIAKNRLLYAIARPVRSILYAAYKKRSS